MFVCLAILTSVLREQEGRSPIPALPPDIPKNATIWLQVTDKTPSGQDAVWTTPDGTVNEFYQFNDRGRGPKTYSTYRLDSRGIVTFEDPETGTQLTVDTSSARLRARFEEAARQQQAEIDERLRRCRVDVLRVSTEDELVPRLARFLAERRAKRSMRGPRSWDQPAPAGGVTR